MANQNQLFDDEWQKRIGVNITDTGNALELDEAISFAKGIKVEALREYMIAVEKYTLYFRGSFFETNKINGSCNMGDENLRRRWSYH